MYSMCTCSSGSMHNQGSFWWPLTSTHFWSQRETRPPLNGSVTLFDPRKNPLVHSWFILLNILHAIFFSKTITFRKIRKGFKEYKTWSHFITITIIYFGQPVLLLCWNGTAVWCWFFFERVWLSVSASRACARVHYFACKRLHSAQ